MPASRRDIEQIFSGVAGRANVKANFYIGRHAFYARPLGSKGAISMVLF